MKNKCCQDVIMQFGNHNHLKCHFIISNIMNLYFHHNRTEHLNHSITSTKNEVTLMQVDKFTACKTCRNNKTLIPQSVEYMLQIGLSYFVIDLRAYFIASFKRKHLIINLSFNKSSNWVLHF